ncbi:hypothetical protein [Flavobacterium sp. WC2509]|uniref:hypothetical protein n=1 Tax=Flavobacterium sp. WC2509 TaxID=3461406 RepID=UPI004043C83F
MKKLFLTVIATLFIANTFANTNHPNPIEKIETNKELTTLFNSSPFSENAYQEVLVKVKITLNENREIVVVETNSKDNVLNDYIKNTLNNQKIASDELRAGEDLEFAIIFTSN